MLLAQVEIVFLVVAAAVFVVLAVCFVVVFSHMGVWLQGYMSGVPISVCFARLPFLFH